MRQIRRMLVSITISVALSCQATNTQALLDGDFGGNDATPPIPISPAKNGRVVGLTAQLTWSVRSGASKYFVEISTTSDFSKPISGSPFTATEAALQVTLPATAGYWWRVKAPFTKGTLVSSLFDTITDGVYVYCPENTTCDDANRGGSKGNPYQSIGVALGAAKTLGLPVRVASRGASGQAYPEAISLVDGVNMYGGYDANFVESQRNPTTNVTAITSGAVPVTASYITKSTVFDGFKVVGQNNFGMYIDNCNANLVIRNSTINSGDITSSNSYAIFLVSSSATITGNTVTGGGAVQAGGSGASYGIFNQSSSPIISSNTISGGLTVGFGASFGISNQGSSPTITNNVIRTGNPTGAAGVFGVQNISGSSPKITNNTIIAGSPASGTSNGIGIGETSPTVASNPAIINNIILSAGGGGSRYCIQEAAGSAGFSNPANLQNNSLFNCPTALYRQIDGGAVNVTAIGNVNLAANTVNTGVSSGNVTITAGNPFVSLAGNNYKLQNSGMSNPEWLDVAYGGLNASGAAFGSVILDFDSVSRTAVAGGALNTGAAGYSMGAYEF